MAKFLLKHSPETASTVIQSHSLELVTILTVINTVIGGSSGDDLNDWLM